MSTRNPRVTETTALLNNAPPSQPRDKSPSATAWYWPWQPSYWAILPTIFLTGLFITPAAIMLPPLLKNLFCERGIPGLVAVHPHPNNQDPPNCDSAEYSAAVAKFFSIVVSFAAGFVTLTARFWSSLSDRIGRKRVLLIGSFALVLSQTLTLVVIHFRGASLYLFWLSGIVEGLSGSVLTIVALTHAYAADVTAPEKRTVVFGRIMAAYYAGVGLGAAWAGIVVKEFDLVAVFWLIPILGLVNTLLLLLIPESLTWKPKTLPDSQSLDTLVTVADENPAMKQDASIASRVEAFVRSFVPEQLPNTLGVKHGATKIMIVGFLALSAIIGVTYQAPIYLMFRFHWPEAQLGLIATIQGLSRFIVLTSFLPLLKLFVPEGSNAASNIEFDLKVMMAATFLEAGTLFMYGVATIGELFYLGKELFRHGALSKAHLVSSPDDPPLTRLSPLFVGL
ncbi:hypothetical protein BGX34_011789 [Mortierella sp. NVP85]|nr:hypothetical protein BGX34_011789 [Mortierella sp. NVP85]